MEAPASIRPSPGSLTRRITDQRTLMRWKKSASYSRIVSHVKSLSDSVVGLQTTH